ncbi:uncharacterized protein LOC123517690 [Portunus trituberculatus]|uniref:uncharacterized protein LOC123517690 n=1 Tax=Portunus trituberculatus TaxID=210409 RepID=UPI001E1D0EAE|nr:uncharacterized protein LOC123517690 [Portunus trituberculatus]
MMVANKCENVIIIGDLNQNTVSEAFNTLMVVHDLHNYITFPTHRSGSSFDPVVTDLPSDTIQCSSLDFVGTSDHVAVLTRISFKRPREECYTRTLWRWEKANWQAMRASLKTTDWDEVLCGDTDQQVGQFTELLHTLQDRWVPHSTHQTKASDQPWFGPECRAASDAKYRAWLTFKRHPTAWNRQRHREATDHMRATQEWASDQWVTDLKRKLRAASAYGPAGGQVSGKWLVLCQYTRKRKNSGKNYRPVSLLPVLSKVLESIVASRVTEHLEKHHLLCSRQFGFRPGRSAADLHLLLTSEWSAALDAGKATAVVALDIEGAFDKVWPAGLLAKLRAAGVDGPILLLFGDYLRERNLKVVIDGQESEQHAVKAGVPQGSCLGPLLWNIYINDLLHLIPSVRAYADDLTLAQSFSSAEDTATADHMNVTRNSIVSWDSKWQVKFAPNKTQMTIISRSRTPLQLSLEGKTIRQQDEMDVLGVTYDFALTFRHHIERLAREASGKLASLRRMSWLLDDKGLEILYKAQFVPPWSTRVLRGEERRAGIFPCWTGYRLGQ